jgi:hypothetical protein
MKYVEYNNIYYDNACVNINIGDINKMQTVLETNENDPMKYLLMNEVEKISNDLLKKKINF